MTQTNAQATTLVNHYRGEMHAHAVELRARVDRLRATITKKIGHGFDIVRAIREIRDTHDH